MLDAYERSAEYYDRMYGRKDYAAEADALRALIYGLQPQARTLLDVGCGTGGHLVRVRESFEVEGLDCSRHMLALARRRLLDVVLHEGDLRRFDLGRHFDAVVCMFSAIGYVRSVDELRQAIRTMAHHLAPGGVLAFEPWFTPDQWRPGGPRGGTIVDEDDLKIARMSVSRTEGRMSIMDMHHWSPITITSSISWSGTRCSWPPMMSIVRR